MKKIKKRNGTAGSRCDRWFEFQGSFPRIFFSSLLSFYSLFLDNVFFFRASIDGAKIADAVSSVLFSLIK